MFAVGLVSMIATRAGYAALADASRSDSLRASAVLLASTAVALGISIAFRGNRYAAAVLQRLQVRHHKARAILR
jgi:hypothetical protein